MIKEAWFKRYDVLPADFDQVVQSWDTANKVSELADFSVCTTWGLKDNAFYLLHVFRKKLSYPDLKRAVHDQRHAFAATVILVEDKASGTQLIQDLLAEGVSMVKGCKPDADKVMRVHAQSATMENGFVHLPKQAHWLDDYLHEMLVFPKGRHDDQVDSTAQAFAWAKQRSANTGMIEFYARMAREQQGGGNGRMTRLLVPPGRTAYLSDGSCPTLRDGIIEVPESEAAPLVAAGFVRV